MRILQHQRLQSQPVPPCGADAFAGLPASIGERLRAEGISTLADWRALGRKRLQLFGITRAVAAELDSMARGVE